MFPPYKYIITRILRNVNKNIRKIRKNSRDFHTTKLNLPTGALDSKATDSLLRLFNRINEDGQTILMVTHSTKAASHANRVLFIKDGQVFHQIYRGNLTNDELYVKIQDALMLITTGGEKHE